MDTPYATVDTLAKAKGLGTYDTALPQEWVDDVKAKTGFYAPTYGFVWCYDKPHSWIGAPIALTDSAVILLAFYEKMLHRGNDAPYHYGASEPCVKAMTTRDCALGHEYR